MGIEIHGAKLLLYARKKGVNFEQSLIVGRQGLHLSEEALLKELRSFQLSLPTETLFHCAPNYCEAFLKFLGANVVESLDNSSYEGASIIHDMNLPIKSEMKQKYSVVIEAGTLEHIFNFPVALKNCMEALRAGGVYFSITPANNFMGHGFYQFSPELFFNVFRKSNRFELLDLFICEIHEDAPWYRISPPKGGIEGRVILRNHNPTYLMCVARRLDATIEPLKFMPQQSDYQQVWTNNKLQVVRGQPQGIRAKRDKLSSKYLLSHIKKIPGLISLVRTARYLRSEIFPVRDYIKFNPNSAGSSWNQPYE